MKNNLIKKIKPEYLFISALIVIPAFLFQENVIIKWIHVFLFILVSFFAGKRIRIIPNLIMLSGITAANLLSPLGEVLFYILKFPVTSGALINGLEKSAMLIGMIYISRTALSGEFSMNRKRRSVITDLFSILRKSWKEIPLYQEKAIINLMIKNCRSHTVSAFINDLIRKADRKLLTLENISKDPVSFKAEEDPYSYSNIVSWGFLIVFISANWALFFL